MSVRKISGNVRTSWPINFTLSPLGVLTTDDLIRIGVKSDQRQLNGGRSNFLVGEKSKVIIDHEVLPCVPKK